jgi:nanoRNase/pAp phosphatase (c-di-AMP/oligoRNAs hydrolase)
MSKNAIQTVAAKNAVVAAIIDALDKRKSFLMLGHKDPDEDCIAAMVAFGLLVTKFVKKATICIDGELHDHFDYLVKICKHNSIAVIDGGRDPGTNFDTVVVCDTPKPSMINHGPSIQPILDSKEIVKIEIDHHLESDSEYFGDEAYRLVDEASSSCELVGLIALKLCHRPELTNKYNITDLLSRNLVLAILTGIIGDSKMGKYLKTKREQRFYRIFSSMFNELLANQTTKAGNFSNQDEVFEELGRLSDREASCHQAFLDRRRTSDHIGFVILDKETSFALYDKYDHDTIVSASRSISDVLAEDSGYLSLVIFYDHPTVSDFVQFKMRRSQAFKRYDLREIIKVFSIENGGGHEGAVGFRIPSPEIEDLEQFAMVLVDRTEEEIAGLIN